MNHDLEAIHGPEAMKHCLETMLRGLETLHPGVGAWNLQTHVRTHATPMHMRMRTHTCGQAHVHTRACAQTRVHTPMHARVHMEVHRYRPGYVRVF